MPDHHPPRPGLRRGPRPLLLHLALAAMRSTSSAGAWQNSSDDWKSFLARARPSPGSVPNAPDAALIHGIAAYRRHPWRRDLTDPAPVWSEGETRLLDHSLSPQSDAPPLLLIPSLINRASILDLAAGHSMARFLASCGLRVLLLDWGWPAEAEREMTLDDLIAGRLSRAIDAIGPRVTLVGYCMGGLLAVASAQLRPDRVAGLAVLATPWDFHAPAGHAAPELPSLIQALEPIMKLTGTLPIDALQALFSLTAPHAVGDKYRGFGTTDQTTDRARQFVAIEDWLNDGVPLAATIARQCLHGWYGENAPARGSWTVAGHSIAPQRLTLPSFIALPGRDRIVPPESAMALARLLPHATLVRPSAGHVGMVAGDSARQALWEPLAAWAAAIPRGFRKRSRARNMVA